MVKRSKQGWLGMSKVKEILRLYELGLSQCEIGRSVQVHRTTVRDYIGKARARDLSYDSRGGGFSPSTIQAVWERGRIIPGRSLDLYRKDCCGAVMYRYTHGDTNSKQGWEMDHTWPVSEGGSDELSK